MVVQQSETPPIEAITSALRTAFDRPMPIVNVDRLVKGHGHESWIVQTDGEQYLLKVSLRATDTRKMRSLMETLVIANANDVPTPRLLAFDQSEELFGNRPYLVQEFLPGTDAEDAWHDLTPKEKEGYFIDFGRAVGKMHTVSCEEFQEDVGVPTGRTSWADLAKDRLERLVRMNQEAAILDAPTLGEVSAKIAALLSDIRPDVAPGLTHRDLYLPNTLVVEGKFRALLDFEHASFSDPMFDFTKLRMWVFEEYPSYEDHFIEGYRQEAEFTADSEDRIRLCLGLELLAGLPYWPRVGQPEMLADYLQRLERWLQ